MGKRDESAFGQIKSGLEDVAAFYRGDLTLRTVELPPPPPQIPAARIRSMRNRMRMSQGVFAATLNVSVRTVQSWEQGQRRPSDAALRLLQLLGEHPAIVRDTIRAGSRKHSTRQPQTASRQRAQRRA